MFLKKIEKIKEKKKKISMMFNTFSSLTFANKQLNDLS